MKAPWKDVTSYSQGERDKVEPRAWGCVRAASE